MLSCRTALNLTFLSLFNILQSFHKKGKRITARRITIASSAISNRTVVTGTAIVSLNAAFDRRMSRSSCGMIMGNPRIAMIAAFCCAFAAMAAKNVKTRLRLHPPNRTRPMKTPALCIGLPRNKLNNARLSALMRSINRELNSSFAKTKSLGPAIE